VLELVITVCKLFLSTILQGVICRENSVSSLPPSTVMTAAMSWLSKQKLSLS